MLEAYLVSGDYDYYIRIAVRDTRDYERLLRERLYRIPGIRHSKSSFVLRRLKESLIPLATAPVTPVGSKRHGIFARHRNQASAHAPRETTPAYLAAVERSLWSALPRTDEKRDRGLALVRLKADH